MMINLERKQVESVRKAMSKMITVMITVTRLVQIVHTQMTIDDEGTTKRKREGTKRRKASIKSTKKNQDAMNAQHLKMQLRQHRRLASMVSLNPPTCQKCNEVSKSG